MTPLADWLVFYQIVGSAAGALTGLQFVAMALIADMPVKNGEEQAGTAFATPTTVHFVAVLMLAASLAMPWHNLDLKLAAAIWALAAAGGLVYGCISVWRMRRQSAYRPVLEDWVFHATLPLVAYAGLLISACRMPGHARGALFGIAGSALLLLLIGIHNAWDNVTYLVFIKRKEANNASL